ncbi:MAG: SH3 domain-containing protein, partial [Anaerolineae bacterium]|nr:SH3 domain-containing protein [Candidatus Roseilinea sp.]MDW8451368.1 SH3 domain-containing protein [Anaerolineae bacterium]
ATETAMPAATATPPAATETSAPTATALLETATATLAAATQVAATAAVTPTVEPAAPTMTAAATESPAEPLACVVAINRALNLRAGPDRTARLLGQLRPGAKFSATGRNAGATWLYGATFRGDFGWVIASAVRCDGDPGGLPVVNGS